MSKWYPKVWNDNGETILDIESETGEVVFSQTLGPNPTLSFEQGVIDEVYKEASAMLAWVLAATKYLDGETA